MRKHCKGNGKGIRKHYKGNGKGMKKHYKGNGKDMRKYFKEKVKVWESNVSWMVKGMRNHCKRMVNVRESIVREW